jgi:hypothetical protein
MRLGGEMHHRRDLPLAEQRLHQLLRPDVAVNEREAGMLPRRLQAGQIARVGQGIQHDHLILGMPGQPIVDEVGADESGTAGYQQPLHAPDPAA